MANLKMSHINFLKIHIVVIVQFIYNNIIPGMMMGRFPKRDPLKSLYRRLIINTLTFGVSIFFTVLHPLFPQSIYLAMNYETHT